MATWPSATFCRVFNGFQGIDGAGKTPPCGEYNGPQRSTVASEALDFRAQVSISVLPGPPQSIPASGTGRDKKEGSQMAKFLNYSVSTSTDAKAKARGLRYV